MSSLNRVLHIITGLDQGGAESVLCRLCLNTDHSKFEHIVVSLTTSGIYGQKLLNAGVKVYCLQIERWYSVGSALFRLYQLIRKSKPNVVQTWMYHSDLLGGIVARIAGVNHVVWNIRGPLNREKTSNRTYAIALISALVSHYIPSKIVSCSVYAKRVHVNLGYAEKIFLVVPNGFSSCGDKNDEVLPVFSKELNISDRNTPLIGMVARYDPFKDHENLLKALAIIKGDNIPFKCLLVGSGLSLDNLELLSWIRKYGLESEIVLVGRQKDTNPLFANLDLHVLSSLDEAFPNVLAESMVCGTPCVATDVGDSSLIIGETGWIVPARDSSALAEAIKAALNELYSVNWPLRQKRCVDRIKDNFGLVRMLKTYEEIWLNNF